MSYNLNEVTMGGRQVEVSKIEAKNLSGPILESKVMHVIFQKKCKKMAKYLKNWAKMYKIRNYFEKGHVIACDNRTQ